jgi:hypothetical protein
MFKVDFFYKEAFNMEQKEQRCVREKPQRLGGEDRRSK